MNEQLREDLEASLAVIAEPEAWCTGYLAWPAESLFDPEHYPVRKHCALGAAMEAIAGERSWSAMWASAEPERFKRVVEALHDALPDSWAKFRIYTPSVNQLANDIAHFNNQNEDGHAGVVELFQRAIKGAIDE